MKLFVGTGNRKKLEELRRRLAATGLALEIVTPSDLPSPPPEPDEPHRTFLENATEKALRYAEATGLLTVADDSGLEVDALDGAPGVDSAYYAGLPKNDAANNAKLLAALEGIPSERRTARYRCVIVLARPGRVLWSGDGACEGRIGTAPRGTGGFGYDPLFEMPGGTRTFAELDPAEKDRVSHRGKALSRLAAALPALLRAEGAAPELQ
jgi:XTP/dITP diphosphohydrolase